MSWTRVNRQNRCTQCKSDSWCLYSDESVLCMRVQSNRPYTLKTGEIGYFHNTGIERRSMPVREARPMPVINCGKLMAHWAEQTKYEWVCRLADDLGVRATALMSLGCAWAAEHRAWAFGMKDGRGNLVGIRLRSESGQKWAVKGSHQGIFLPQCPAGRLGLVAEGPTDLAAALSLGFYAVGRPNCSGGMQDIRTAFTRLGVTRAAIIADNDDVGMLGAETLTRHLPMPTCILAIPAEDLREYVRLGGTKALLDSMIESAVWRQ